MEIHLVKPGGPREGPFTLEQINRDLTSRKYQDTDYWAWYEGLSDWVPLYDVPGVVEVSAVSAAEPPPASRVAAEPVRAAAKPATKAVAVAEETAAQPPVPTRPPVSSEMPLAALEQIFVLTTGEGEPAARSPAVAKMLQETSGADMETLRQNVPRHVITRCGVIERMREGGAFPESVWRAIARINPALVQQAREGLYKVCARAFLIETNDVVTVFLFYRKQQT